MHDILECVMLLQNGREEVQGSESIRMMMEEATVVGRLGWWWAVAISVPFSIYSIPFLLGKFELYKHLTIAAAAGHHHLAGLHIANYIAVWQVHVAFGLVFMAVAPFQFCSSEFRARHLKLHRQMGYLFVAASMVLDSTGATVMTLNCEFQQLGRIVFVLGGVLQALSVAMAIVAAKQKRILQHRHYMIRAAAIGYAVINARIVLLVLQMVFHVPILIVADYSIAISFASNVAVAELYIQRYLIRTKNKKDR